MQKTISSQSNIEHTWAVVKKNKIIGYVRHKFKNKALNIAYDNFGPNILLEQLYLVGLVPESKNFYLVKE